MLKDAFKSLSIRSSPFLECEVLYWLIMKPQIICTIRLIANLNPLARGAKDPETTLSSWNSVEWTTFGDLPSPLRLIALPFAHMSSLESTNHAIRVASYSQGRRYLFAEYFFYRQTGQELSQLTWTLNIRSRFRLAKVGWRMEL